MSGDEIFGYGWREDHARAGDLALEAAESLAREPRQERLIQEVNGGRLTSRDSAEGLKIAGTLAAIAQAHYAAANIRTRPIRNAELPVTNLDWMTRERSG